MIHPQRKFVGVFGANDPEAGREACETARAVGRQIARLGYGVVNGGYGGTMEASARGAREAGGPTIGVICTTWHSQPNPYVDQVIRTESLRDRLARLVELATGGYVVLPGATGTLLELAWVWEYTCKRILDRRPLVCLGRFWEPLLAMMSSRRASSGEVIAAVEHPDELARYFPAAGAGFVPS